MKTFEVRYNETRTHLQQFRNIFASSEEAARVLLLQLVPSAFNIYVQECFTGSGKVETFT